MARPVILFSSPWADVPVEELAQLAADWGYQGLELCSWGRHLDVTSAVADPDYCPRLLDALARHEQGVPVVGAYRLGLALADSADERHRPFLPDPVWGDGDPAGVRERSLRAMLAAVEAAQKLGAGVVAGFTGSPLSAWMAGYPPPAPDAVRSAFRQAADALAPVLDACRDAGVRFALEVHPGQIAFDLHSAEAVLDVLGGREEFGFTFDPSHLHWQGVDPVEFLRRFPDRIYHVHVKDASLNLNGRNGVLSTFLPPGDPRRGWDARSPGRGGIDWEALIRCLNSIDYQGSLSVDWSDPGMDRDFGAEEACRFVKRLNFPTGQGKAARQDRPA